jgi:putative multiple sugar transport system ATP-binding protein
MKEKRMSLISALPDGARLIAVLGDLPVVDGVPVLGMESLLLPFQSVGDNVLLGSASGFFLHKQSRERRAMELLDRVGLAVPPTTPVFELDTVDQRIVELAGVLARTPELVLVDDRSSRFDAGEALRWHTALAHATEVAPVLIVVNTLADLRSSPRAVDCVAVVRAGEVVGTAAPADADRLMGLFLGDRPGAEENSAPTKPDRPRANRPFGPVVLELNKVSVSHPVHRERMLVEDASLTVRAGEIVALADAQDLVLGVFGASSGGEVSGTVLLDGAPADLSTVERAIASRVLFISEHPPTYDIGLLGGIPTNVSGEKLARLARMGIIDRRREYIPRQAPSMLLDAISGARSRPSTAAMNDVLAGWAANPPRVAMITEPFSGLSQAERRERRALIERIAAAGAAVIIESTEPEQLVGLSDRLILQHGRRLTTELRGEDATIRGVAAFRIRTDFQPEI